MCIHPDLSKLIVFTGEERWLATLNNDHLQNMLPDNVRKKAVEIKPLLLNILKNESWILSIQ